EAVVRREIPPWHGAPAIGRFRNDQSLTDAEIQVLSSWVDGGAPEGEFKESPAGVQSPVSCRFGRPDVVFEPATPFDVPPAGTVEYVYHILPSGFKEDRWVQ